LKKSPSPLSGLAAVAGAPVPTVQIDAVDRQLLVLLARDSRISQRRLGRELRMSPPAIGERIARLEKARVIRGYSVVVDWSVLGYVTCYLAVSATQGAEQGPIMAVLEQLPEVEDVSVITGSIDMLVRVRVRDHAHLRQLLLDHVWQIDGVQRTETFLSLAEMPPKDLTSALLAPEDAEPAADAAGGQP
jgi:DNA-binding Lrp family transcriptional regulator